MREVFSNNAVGTLAAGISSSDTEITLSNTAWAANFAYVEEGDFQRATLSLDGADEIEIVYITANGGGLTLTVQRGQEDTAPLGWAAGAKLSARVTAGMLNQCLTQDTDTGNISTRPGAPSGRFLVNSRSNATAAPVQLAGYPVLPLMTASPSGSAGASMTSDLNMGRVIVGGTLPVNLGDDVPVWTAGALYADGSIVAPAAPDGFNYVFQAAKGWETSQTTTPPEFSGSAYSCDALNDGNVVGLWVPIPDPLAITVDFPSSYGLVLSEVGFVCLNYDASSDASVSIGTSSSNTRFASAVALSDVGAAETVHRIPVTEGGALVKNLRFAVTTPATGSLEGRFYWRGFFVQLSA